ncbi:NUDIX hydrolase [Ruegeria marina]|uniref:ADP-ribose pyrophosphatase YjhB, NUDIX family n=1 Tax=Ruegeria marina TaxID=639004 RepID=A0A1G7BDP7_9RHOB|nr:NUDIX hydrolase [Ruegeria marina]SDE25169.1 ADP-ribose pyrophosphatase YjhB, NUDIX family [Ruegeria marina]
MDQRPLIGALAVVIHDDHVLLAQRGKDPGRGLWGFPGGHVEWGETVRDAAVRELFEETGILARPQRYLTHFDLIRRDDAGETLAHYLLVSVLCRYVDGAPRAGDDAMDARWLPVAEVLNGALPLLDRVGELLDLARRRG